LEEARKLTISDDASLVEIEEAGVEFREITDVLLDAKVFEE
jgi:hypothetical protein